MTHPWNGWDDTHIKCLLANTTHRSKHELLQYHHQPIIELEWQQPLQQPRKRSSALWRLLVVRKNKVLVMKKSQHAYELKAWHQHPYWGPAHSDLHVLPSFGQAYLCCVASIRKDRQWERLCSSCVRSISSWRPAGDVQHTLGRVDCAGNLDTSNQADANAIITVFQCTSGSSQEINSFLL